MAFRPWASMPQTDYSKWLADRFNEGANALKSALGPPASVPTPRIPSPAFQGSVARGAVGTPLPVPTPYRPAMPSTPAPLPSPTPLSNAGIGFNVNTSDLETAGRGFVAGLGDVVAETGRTANWLNRTIAASPYEPVRKFGASAQMGVPVYNWLEKQGQNISQQYQPNPYEFKTGANIPETVVRNVTSPEFWTKGLSRQLPGLLAFLIPSVGAEAGTAKLVTSLAPKLGPKMASLLSSVGAGVGSRLFESAVEAGDTYSAGLAKGLSDDEALSAASDAFLKNLPLSVSDAAQWILAFRALPKGTQKILGGQVARTLGQKGLGALKVLGTVGGKTLATGGLQAAEEGWQDYVQRSSLGEPYRLGDPQSMQAMTTGGVLGVGMGGVGNIAQAGAPVARQIAAGEAGELNLGTKPEFRSSVPERGKITSAEDLLGGGRQRDEAGNPIPTREEQLAAGQADMFGAETPTASPSPTANAQPARRILTPQERVAYQGQHAPFKVADLGVDPDRFQYKVERRGPSGETGSLSGAKVWNRTLEGEVGAWIDPATGEVWVVDGHNRVAAAKRLGVDTLQNVYFMLVKTAGETTIVGALRNIAQGRGTQIDAANFFRKTGATPETLSDLGVVLKEGMVRDGLALADLQQSLFDKVRTGEMPIERAIVIGQRLKNPDLQVRLVQMLDAQTAKGKKITNDVVAELADMIDSAPKEQVTQDTLFGTDTFTETYALEKAEVTAYIRQRMSKDKRLFGMAAQYASQLERGGNIIARETSAGISEESGRLLAIFDATKNTVGEVTDAVNNAARRLANGESAVKVREETYAAVTEALPRVIAGGVGESGAGLQGVSRTPPQPASEVAPVQATEAATAEAAPALEPTPEGPVEPPPIEGVLSQPEAPVGGPFAAFLRDVSVIERNPKSVYKRRGQGMLTPVAQNKIIQRAIQAADEGVISARELRDIAEQYFALDREASLTGDQIVAYYRGQLKLNPRDYHAQGMTPEQIDSMMAQLQERPITPVGTPAQLPPTPKPQPVPASTPPQSVSPTQPVSPAPSVTPSGAGVQPQLMPSEPPRAGVTPPLRPPVEPPGVPPGEPPVTPPPAPTPPPPRPKGERDFQGTGVWNDLPEDMQADLLPKWRRIRAEKETIPDAEVAELAKKIQMTPDELAQAWKDVPPAELSAQLLLMRSAIDDAQLKIDALEGKIARGQGKMTPAELSAAEHELAQANLRQMMLFSALGRRGSEAGRALRILRVGVHSFAQGVIAEQYKQIGLQISRVANEIKNAKPNGKMAPKTRGDLEKLADTLRRETEGEEPAPRKGGGSAEVQAEPRLSEDLVRLNREQNSAREAGDFNRVDRIELQRQDLLGQIEEQIRERILKAMRKKKPELTEEQLQQAVDARMASDIERIVAKRIKREIEGEQVQGAIRAAKSANETERLTEQRMVAEKLKLIDRMKKAGAYDRLLDEEANIALADLATQSGWADVAVYRYKAKLAEQAKQAQPLADRIVQLDHEIKQAQGIPGGAEFALSGETVTGVRAMPSKVTGVAMDAERVKALRAERDDLTRQLDEEVRAAVQKERAAKAADKPELTPQEQWLAEAELKQQLIRKAAGRLVAKRRARIVEEESGFGALTSRTERDVQRRWDRALAREALVAIDRVLKAAPDSKEFREAADIALKELSTLTGEADLVVQRYRAASNKARAATLLPKDASPEQIDAIAVQLGKLKWADPRAFAQFAAALAEKPSLWQHIHQYRLASMLFNTGTMITNTLGSAIETGRAPMVRVLAAGVEKLAPIEGRGKAPNATLRMASDEVAHLAEALPSAIEEFATTLRTGISSRPIRETGRFRASAFDSKNPLTIPLKPLGYAFRILAATDDLFRTLNRQTALLAHAGLEAKRRGVSREAILTNLTKYPEVVERAENDALQRTYQQPMGSLGTAILRLRSNPVGAVLLPFFQTLWNLTRRGVEMTPYGLVRARGLAKEGKYVEAAQMRGEVAFGAVVMTGAAIMTASGLVTAYGPSDPQERALWRAQGGQPFSVKIGNTWVSYVNLGAIAIPIAVAASGVEAMKDARETRGTLGVQLQTTLQQTASRFSAVFLEQSALKGITDFYQAVTQPSRAEYWVEALTTSYMPYGGLLAQLARVTDSEIKDTRTMWDAIQARIPGLSRNVPGAITPLGESRYRAAQGAVAFLPIRATEERMGPVYAEVNRLRDLGEDVNLTFVGNTIGGIKLDEREAAAYQRLAGETTKRYLDALVASPWYKSLPSAQQAKEIQTATGRARDRTRAEYLAQLGEANVRDPKRLADGATTQDADQAVALAKSGRYQGDVPEEYVKALELYREYQTMPTYLGFTQAQIDAVNQATSAISTISKGLPPNMANKTRYAMALALSRYPQLAMGIRLIPIAAKRRNPMRKQFWYQNATLLNKYYGSVPTTQAVAA